MWEISRVVVNCVELQKKLSKKSKNVWNVMNHSQNMVSEFNLRVAKKMGILFFGSYLRCVGRTLRLLSSSHYGGIVSMDIARLGGYHLFDGSNLSRQFVVEIVWDREENDLIPFDGGDQ